MTKLQVVSELTGVQRILYRTLMPLILGACLVTVIGALVWNPLEESDAPVWMKSFYFRFGVSLFVLGYAAWLSSRASEVPLWVKLDIDGSLHVKRIWSRRVRIHPIKDVAGVIDTTEGLVGRWVTFRSGYRLRLEGRPGPGMAVLESWSPCSSTQVHLN